VIIIAPIKFSDDVGFETSNYSYNGRMAGYSTSKKRGMGIE